MFVGGKNFWNQKVINCTILKFRAIGKYSKNTRRVNDFPSILKYGRKIVMKCSVTFLEIALECALLHRSSRLCIAWLMAAEHSGSLWQLVNIVLASFLRGFRILDSFSRNSPKRLLTAFKLAWIDFGNPPKGLAVKAVGSFDCSQSFNFETEFWNLIA